MSESLRSSRFAFQKEDKEYSGMPIDFGAKTAREGIVQPVRVTPEIIHVSRSETVSTKTGDKEEK